MFAAVWFCLLWPIYFFHLCQYEMLLMELTACSSCSGVVFLFRSNRKIGLAQGPGCDLNPSLSDPWDDTTFFFIWSHGHHGLPFYDIRWRSSHPMTSHVGQIISPEPPSTLWWNFKFGRIDVFHGTLGLMNISPSCMSTGVWQIEGFAKCEHKPLSITNPTPPSLSI